VFEMRGGFAACLRFTVAFGTICAGEAHGACENQKTDGDAEAAACEGGYEAAVGEMERE